MRAHARPARLESARVWLTAKWWHPLALAGCLVLLLGVATVAPAAMADLDRVAEMPIASTVYDRHGKPVFAIFDEYRVEAQLRDVSPKLVQAVLATEDESFFFHPGIMPTRIVAAAWHNLRRRELAQGGSTITQQLARATFLSGEKTLRRKLAEAVLAFRIEWQYDKNEILRWYLNRVYFGRGLYGIEAASRGYFGKHARDLTLAEAALLAGLIKAPSAYAPPDNLARAIERQHVVLGRMVDVGFIDQTMATEAERAPLVFREHLGPGQPFGDYFKNHVARALVAEFGWERVSQGGLRVYTTVDPEVQRIAERELRAGLERIEKLAAYKTARRREARLRETQDNGEALDHRLQGALVALDPASGNVLALVGGRDYHDSSFDRATRALRQAGSAFKPLIYAAALEEGLTPATMISGLDTPVETHSGPWVPADGHSDAAAMTVRRALRTSSNRAAVQVVQQIGIPRTLAHVLNLGVEPQPAVPAVALGAGEVTLLSLTSAYAAFVNSGIVQAPTFIRRVEDPEGNILYQSHTEPRRAISAATAFLMSTLLADVVDRGTGARARREGLRRPAAGKTGTTNDYRDAWFIGFSPALVAGVWVGFDQPRTIMAQGYATQLAVPIWARFMKDADKSPPAWLQMPPDVVMTEVCLVTGLRPSPGCEQVPTPDDEGFIETRSTVGMEYFRRGTEPFATCELHADPGFDVFRWLFGRGGGRGRGGR
jgi:penicillin-binding protein 1A